MPGRFIGRCAGVALDTAPDAARTLRDVRPYFHIRGWCLTKMTGFPISESREELRLAGHAEMAGLDGGFRSVVGERGSEAKAK